jgi:AbrB family looped-hinge helix DNA binding protein
VINEQPLTLSIRIGKRGQIVLPIEARRRLGLNEGDQLLMLVAKDGVMTILPRPTSFTEALAGIGADTWRGVDPVAYQREERDSWPD